MKGAETRRTVLLAAATAFSEKGYKGTTLQDIARSAGIQAASIYYYFKSKENILREVISEGIGAIDSAVREALASLPRSSTPREKMRGAIHIFLLTHLDLSDYSHAYVRLYNRLPSAIKRQDHPKRVAFLEIWRQLLIDGQKSGDFREDINVDVFVEFLLGSMSRARDWYNPQTVSIDELARSVDDWIFRGIGRVARK